MEIFDVIIIGGGPIGCNVASNLASAGFSVAVLEAKTRIGFPNHCSGLVPVEFIELAGLSDSLVLNYINGAEVDSYKESNFSFKRENPYAVVIDRSNFDTLMEQRAKRNGAKFFYNAHIELIENITDKISITLKNGNSFEAKVLVVAAGATSAIQRMLNVNMEGETIYTAQVDAEIELPQTDLAYIYMNNNIAHNWFSWIIPTNGNKARVGFGTDIGKNLLYKLDELFKSWSRLSKAKIIDKPVVWSIPIGIVKQTVFKNALFVGDSAHIVKPFSGGGLLTGFIAGNILSDTIIEAFKGNPKDFYRILKQYDKRWKRILLPEFKKEIVLRNIYKTLTDEDKDIIVKNLNKDKVSETLVRYGFMDKPAITGLKLLLTNPQIPLTYIKRKISG